MTTLTPPKTSFAALMRLAGPIFVANIAIVGSGTIDTIMAGQLGKNHLAAIAVSIAATISVVMGLAGILQSLSPIAGHHYGARNYRAVGEELEQNFWLGGFLCLFGVPLLMYTELWISLGKVEGEVARMAAEFLFFTALALPACLFARTFISVNAALSRPRITMWVSLAMLALKVPLNGIFMYGWLGRRRLVLHPQLPRLPLLPRHLEARRLLPHDARRTHLRPEVGADERAAPRRHSDRPEHLLRGLELHADGNLRRTLRLRGRFRPPNRGQHHEPLLHAAPLDRHRLVRTHLPVPRCTLAGRGLHGAHAHAQGLGGERDLHRHHPLLRAPLARDALLVRHGRVRDGGLAPHLRLPLPRLRRHAVRELVRPSRLPRHAPADDHLRRHALGRGPRRRLHARLRQPDHGFWSATAAGLWLTGISLACMAIWVGRQFARDDNHTPEEIEEAVKVSRA